MFTVEPERALVAEISCLGEEGGRVDVVWNNLLMYEDEDVHPSLRAAKQIRWDWGEKPGIHYTAQTQLVEDMLWTEGMENLIVSTRFREWHESIWPGTATFAAHRIHNVATNQPVCNGNYWHMRIVESYECGDPPTGDSAGDVWGPSEVVDLRKVPTTAALWRVTKCRYTVFCSKEYRKECIRAKLRGPQFSFYDYIDRDGCLCRIDFSSRHRHKRK